MFINFVKQQIEIVEEESHSPSASRSHTVSSANSTTTADDDDMLQDVLEDEVPLDDDEPLLSFDGPGVGRDCWTV